MNGISLENVDYATAVQVLRDSGNTVTLVVKRRVHNLGMMTSGVIDVHQHQHNNSHQHSNSLISSNGLLGTPTAVAPVVAGLPAPSMKVVLTKSSKKDDFGIVLGCRLFVKVIE